jgi:hypothetical protein
LVNREVASRGKPKDLPMIFASDFGGKWLLLGCAFSIIFPLICFVWIAVQMKALLTVSSLSIPTLAFIILASVLPAFVVATSLRELAMLSGYSKLIFNLSLCGLVLLPVTLAREIFKFIRDRPRRPRRKRRRRADSAKLEEPSGDLGGD